MDGGVSDRQAVALSTRTQNDYNSQLSQSDRISIARSHFVKKGYRVHSGLQFGCELVLYADIPSRVHSDFCVHIPTEDTSLNWMTIQILVRSMPDLHKTLIIGNVKKCSAMNSDAIAYTPTTSIKTDRSSVESMNYYLVEEIAITSEHAPFRHKNTIIDVGGQLKKRK